VGSSSFHLPASTFRPPSAQLHSLTFTPLQESFDSYYSEMPWLALPFDQRDLKAKLSSKFKVSGIPSFVILDTFTGAVVNPQARGAVGEDPEGKDFPWRPKTISQLLSGAELVDKAGNTYKSDDLLNGKTKMVYFSAHWCPPCRGFTPQLAETYTKMKAAGRDFELIFVSSDKDQASFDGYLAEMPWQALKFEDRKRKAELSEAFKVNGIPTLVVLDEKNNIITTSGRGSVAADPEGHKFPWVAEPVALLGEDSVDIVNEIPTVIFISNAQEAAEVEKKAKETLEALAIKSKADVDAGKKEESLGFLFGPSKGNQVMESVLKFAGVKVEDGQDALIILNVGEQCLYKLEGEVDVEAAIKFVAEFEAGTLTKIKIGGNEDDE
jgi:nucleoredoxin